MEDSEGGKEGKGIFVGSAWLVGEWGLAMGLAARKVRFFLAGVPGTFWTLWHQQWSAMRFSGCPTSLQALCPDCGACKKGHRH